jgi:ABC-type glycerol-3-phosphate transport system substrate-binding protein
MGGSLYREDHSATDMTSPQAIEAFTMWTAFYTDYKYPVTADFYNRFRTGLIPMGIQPYTMYPILSVAAPEIKGKWAMSEIPGILHEDGTLDKRQAGAGMGGGILKQSKNADAAWELLKWWTSEDTQLSYSNGLESILGVSGRIPTANIDALLRMPWDRESRLALSRQQKQIQELPELPGGYDVARAIDQAYWNVVNNNEQPRKMLIKWSRIADEEITRKRLEYNVK